MKTTVILNMLLTDPEMADKLMDLSKLAKSFVPWLSSLIDEMNGLLTWGQEIIQRMAETSLRIRGRFVYHCSIKHHKTVILLRNNMVPEAQFALYSTIVSHFN